MGIEKTGLRKTRLKMVNFSPTLQGEAILQNLGMLKNIEQF